MSQRERTESSCSSGYGSCGSTSRNDHHKQHHKSPQRKNNHNRPGGAGQRPHYPEMTLICHRVDLFDDFVASRSNPNNDVSVLVPVRCLGVNGGCACRTPCAFCHALIEDDGIEVDTTHEAPVDIHPGFAFLFAGGNANAHPKEDDEKIKHQDETTVRTLSIDPIFAHNHGLIPEHGEESGVVKMKRFHHPPVGKYKYTAPLVELPAFFSGDDSVYEQKQPDIKNVATNNATDDGGGLDSFFDDFVTTAPPKAAQVSKQDDSKDHKVLILRTPTKTVVKKVLSSNANAAAGKCLCESRYDTLKKGSDQPNPHDPSVVHNKYWAQRRRLFKKFDEGIQLDAEGWYSVTPEVVADHVGARFVEASGRLVRCQVSNYSKRKNKQKQSKSMVILDAFCGCGGNAIAFAKLSASIVSLIVCVDVDRTKLRKAAHNASIYNIPPHRIVFIEANSVAVMER